MQFTKQRGTSAFNNLTVPSAAFREGDFSSLVVNNSPVTIYDPGDNIRSKQSAHAFPRKPNSGGAHQPGREECSGACIRCRRSTRTLQTTPTSVPFDDDNYEYDVKIDHNFSDSDKFFARYSARKTDSIPASAFPDPNAGGRNPGQLGFGANKNHSRQAVVNYVKIFSPRLTNNLIVGWFQTYPKREVAGYGKVSTNSLGIFGLPNGDDKLGTPDFQFTNYAPLGSSGDTLFFELQDSKSLVNQTSWVLNRHTLKFGGEARLIRTDNLQPNPGTTVWNFQPIYTNQTWRRQYRLGLCQLSAGPAAHVRLSNLPRLLQVALIRVRAVPAGRHPRQPQTDHQSRACAGTRRFSTTEAEDRSGVFDLDKGQYQQFGQNGFRRTPWKNDWNNFGPRFGFAYNIADKTVLRGGFGIFSVGTMSSGAFGFLQSDPIFADADAGRYNTVDQITPGTTLDRIPYKPVDKLGRNALSVSIYPRRQSDVVLLAVELQRPAGDRRIHVRSRLRRQQRQPLALRRIQPERDSGRSRADCARTPHRAVCAAIRSIRTA